MKDFGKEYLAEIAKKLDDGFDNICKTNEQKKYFAQAIIAYCLISIMGIDKEK